MVNQASAFPVSNEAAKQEVVSRKPVKRKKKTIRLNARKFEAAAVWVDIDKLLPWVKNPRKKDRDKDRKLARAIKKDGFGRSVVARKANHELIAGHRSVRAAKIAGLTRVPVRLLDVSAKQAHRMALADNRHGRDVDDDAEMLLDAIEDDELSEDDLELAGFEEKEIEKLLGEDDDDEGDDEEDDDGLEEELGEKFQVVVTCKDEDEQTKLLERLGDEGLDVRALIG